MKNGFILNVRNARIYDLIQIKFQNRHKARSIWKENNALCFVRSKGCGDLLKPGETVNSDRYQI